MRWTRGQKMDWTRWFAWHPIQLETGQWVWLETVERKFVCCRPGPTGLEDVFVCRQVVAPGAQEEGELRCDTL